MNYLTGVAPLARQYHYNCKCRYSLVALKIITG